MLRCDRYQTFHLCVLCLSVLSCIDSLDSCFLLAMLFCYSDSAILKKIDTPFSVCDLSCFCRHWRRHCWCSTPTGWQRSTRWSRSCGKRHTAIETSTASRSRQTLMVPNPMPTESSCKQVVLSSRCEDAALLDKKCVSSFYLSDIPSAGRKIFKSNFSSSRENA